MRSSYRVVIKRVGLLLVFSCCFIHLASAIHFPSLFKKKEDKRVIPAKTFDHNIRLIQSEQHFKAVFTPVKPHNAYFDLHDYDHDGIPDKYDNCPSTPGLPERFGCPEIDPTKMITFARHTISMSDIDFENAVYAFNQLSLANGKLTESTRGSLDGFIKMLKRRKNLMVSLSSYVDMGAGVDNVELSKIHLKELKSYMIKRGISPRRIKGYFFGDTMPVVDLPLSRFEVEIDY